MISQFTSLEQKNDCLFPFLIGGEWRGNSTYKKLTLRNPSTGDQLAQVAQTSPSELDLAVQIASQSFAQGHWRCLTGDRRSQIMWRIADLIEQAADELAQLEMLNSGKLYQDCRFGEIPFAAQCFRYFAGWCSKLDGKFKTFSGLSEGEFFAHTCHEPIGVVALMLPWNGPLVQACWKIAPALAAGCSVIVKPSELTPLSTLRLGEIMLQAGLPAGVLSIIVGDAHLGTLLSNHDGIDKVSFTGSTNVGRQIVKASAGNLKKLTLELGGKSPVIVLPDADLNSAVNGIVSGVFSNAGQVCVAGSRVYVHSSMYDELADAVCLRAKALKVGAAYDHDTQMGPLISREHLQRVLEMINVGQEEGAHLQVGGARPSDASLPAWG